MGVPNSDQFVLKQNNEAAKRERGHSRPLQRLGHALVCGSVPQLDATRVCPESAQCLMMVILMCIANTVPGRQAHRHDNTRNRNNAYKNTV